ncbi:MAG: hypothetical protein C4B58_16290, partial [Deltaproteobacteria bacterium]
RKKRPWSEPSKPYAASTTTVYQLGAKMRFSPNKCGSQSTLTLIEIIEESEDSIRVYPLCAACETGISILGQGKIMKEKDVYIL